MNGFQREVTRLGQRIRQLRRQKGLTQRQLAEKAGVFDVGELERGYKVKGGSAVNPRIETLSRIAVALDVQLEELFGHAVPDEAVQRISTLLDGRSADMKRQAVRIVEVLADSQ